MVKKTRIFTKDNLFIRGWQGDDKCLFCGDRETGDHLFVQCIIAQRIWKWIASFNCEIVKKTCGL